MSKRNLLNLFLFVFTLALVAVVLIEPGKKEATTPPTLTTLNAADIHSIEIQRPDMATGAPNQNIEFKKTTQGWQLVKPFSVSANLFRVESILKLLSAPSLSTNNLATLDTSKFGLDQPLVTVTFNDTKIEFGHNKSLKNHRYVKVGSTLHMIADTFFYQVNAKAESYIDHKLLPQNARITKLQLPTIKLEQTEGKWVVTPKAENLSADSITQLINEWQLSQAYDVNIKKPQSHSKEDITITLANNQALRFRIVGSTENFVLVNIDTGISYVLSKDRQDKLLKLNELNP